MRTTYSLLACIVGLVTAAAGPATQQTKPDPAYPYKIEYTPAKLAGYPASLFITYKTLPPEPVIAADLAREIRLRVATDQPKGDILAVAWLHKPATDSSDDEEIGDKVDRPVYIAKTGTFSNQQAVEAGNKP